MLSRTARCSALLMHQNPGGVRVCTRVRTSGPDLATHLRRESQIPSVSLVTVAHRLSRGAPVGTDFANAVYRWHWQKLVFNEMSGRGQWWREQGRGTGQPRGLLGFRPVGSPARWVILWEIAVEGYFCLSVGAAHPGERQGLPLADLPQFRASPWGRGGALHGAPRGHRCSWMTDGCHTDPGLVIVTVRKTPGS